MRHIRVSVFAAAVLSAALLVGCGGKKPDGKTKENVADKPVPVRVALVKKQPVQRTVDFVGTLEPLEEATVASNIEVPVARVYVDLGDRVEKGRVIVKLDDEEFRIKERLADASLKEALAKLGVEDEKDIVVENVSYVKKAKAELGDAELNLKRMKELEAKGYIARSQLDEALARRDVARANLDSQVEYGRSLYSTVKTKRAALELARKELRDAEVRAPISGYVGRRMVDPGDFVKVGGELVSIVKVDPIRLRGEVPEVNAPDIRNGQEVSVRLSAAPDRTFSGKITRISPSSSRESRAFIVEVMIANPGAALKPGYFAEASVKTRLDSDAVTVPINSVISFAGVNKIFVVEGGKAVEKVVTPGARVGGDVEVSGDIRPGDTVVTTGMKRLFDGKQVAVRD